MIFYHNQKRLNILNFENNCSFTFISSMFESKQFSLDIFNDFIRLSPTMLVLISFIRKNFAQSKKVKIIDSKDFFWPITCLKKVKMNLKAVLLPAIFFIK